MADGLDVVRDLDEIVKAFGEAKKEMSATKDELASVNRALRLDSGNVELLDKRSGLLAKQLEENKEKSELLGEAITELNRIKTESGNLDATQTKQLANFTKQQKDAENQVIGLTGAIQKQAQAEQEAADKEAKLAEESAKAEEALKLQAETTVAVEENTKSFSQSMTEFQSNLRAAQQIIRGVDSAFKLFGGDPDSTMGKMIKQGQQAVQMMSGIASMGKMLEKQNSGLAKSFSTVAIAAGAAAAAYSLGSSMLNSLDEDTRKIVAPLMIAVGALTAVAVAGLAAAGALSWGTAVPIITAAVGAGVAGIMAMLPKTPEAALSDVSPSLSIPEIPSPSSTSSTGNSTKTVSGTIIVRFEGDTPQSEALAKQTALETSKIVNQQLGAIII